MALRIEITRLVARMVMMLARDLLHALVSMPMGVEVTRGVTRMVVMLAGYFLHALIAMSVLVEITGLMAGVIVMNTSFLFCHVVFPPFECRIGAPPLTRRFSRPRSADILQARPL